MTSRLISTVSTLSGHFVSKDYTERQVQVAYHKTVHLQYRALKERAETLTLIEYQSLYYLKRDTFRIV